MMQTMESVLAAILQIVNFCAFQVSAEVGCTVLKLVKLDFCTKVGSMQPNCAERCPGTYTLTSLIFRKTGRGNRDSRGGGGGPTPSQRTCQRHMLPAILLG